MLDDTKAFDRVQYCKLVCQVVRQEVTCCYQIITKHIYIHPMLPESHGISLTLTAFVLQTGLSRVLYLALFCFFYTF